MTVLWNGSGTDFAVQYPMREVTLPVHGNKMPGSGDGKNGLEDLARQAANQIFGYRRQCCGSASK